MRKLIWSKTFVKAFKRARKKYPTLDKDIEETLKLLSQNTFSPKLETHKLKGKLSGSWACSVSYDLRIIFDFVKNRSNTEDDVFLIEIGSHEDVY
jgi:mRNA interferase YafQ